MGLTVQEFLAPYRPEVRDLTLKIRELVLKNMPVTQISPEIPPATVCSSP